MILRNSSICRTLSLTISSLPGLTGGFSGFLRVIPMGKTARRNTARLAAGFLSVFALLFGCQGYLCGEEDPSLFWPPPPAEIKVVFIKSIYGPEDVGIKPTFFKKIKGFIVGGEKDALSRPIAVAVDSQGAIYVCDPGIPAVHVFNQEEKQYKRITAIDGQALASPVSVAISKNGLVFISDSKLRKVFCLDRKGRTQFVIGDDKTFLRPTGLAASEEKLYVVDTAAHRVFMFDLKGNFLDGFGQRGRKTGEFNYPTSVALDQEGKVYIVDTLNFRIQVFDQANHFLFAIGQAGDGSGFFSRPKGVAVDSFGHIYSTDGLSDNVQIFSQKEEFLLSLGESGHGRGEFWIVSGVAIDEKNYIYVADSYNQRIQVFRYVGKE